MDLCDVLILGENFESLSPGDNYADGPLLGVFNATDFLVANDNPDLNGNHLDGDSTHGEMENVFSFEDRDYGGPTTGSIYIEGTADNVGHNFIIGVENSSANTAYSIYYGGSQGWGSGFGPNGAAHSGLDVIDTANPQRAITRVNLDGGFSSSYSFLVVDLKTGASWGHGGEVSVPNHIPGFGTPNLHIYYDRRASQDIDFDDFRIATMPWIPPLIPEPATFALLGLGSLLMLRRRV